MTIVSFFWSDLILVSFRTDLELSLSVCSLVVIFVHIAHVSWFFFNYFDFFIEVGSTKWSVGWPNLMFWLIIIVFLGHIQVELATMCEILTEKWKSNYILYFSHYFKLLNCSRKSSVLMDFNHSSVMSWQMSGLNHSSVNMFEWFASCEQLVGCEQPERSWHWWISIIYLSWFGRYVIQVTHLWTCLSGFLTVSS